MNAFSGIERAARLKLDRLETATTLKAFAVLPGNWFEALAGDPKGQYSIRIYDQWRICFEWPDPAQLFIQENIGRKNSTRLGWARRNWRASWMFRPTASPES